MSLIEHVEAYLPTGDDVDRTGPSNHSTEETALKGHFNEPISFSLVRKSKPKRKPITRRKEKMAEAKNTVDSIREWVVDHKLRTVGNLSLSLSLSPFLFIICGLYVYLGLILMG